jgi:hypothetical protein
MSGHARDIARSENVGMRYGLQIAFTTMNPPASVATPLAAIHAGALAPVTQMK